MAMPMLRMILVVFAMVQTVFALSCSSCDKTACVEPLNCKAGLVKGLCGCCDVCAKLENERCGGPWYIYGKCAERLKCVTRTQLDKRDRFQPGYFETGVCEPADACHNKTCGFRQKCKINRRGDPVCVCPRRCGKAKKPVCGLLNGKQYRNKCKLQREECLTKTKIGLIAGKCKRCTHSGNVFKFGDSRPDAKPCETCTCHHGLWKCDIRPNCFLNNLPIQSDHPPCLVAQDGKIHVLPCPRGLSCRVPKSDKVHDSFRVGVCKQKKAKKPNKASKLVEEHEMNNIFESDQEGLSADTFAERRMPAESEYREIPVFTEMKMTAGTTRSTSVPATVQLRSDQQLNGDLMTHVCLAYPDQRSCSSITSIRWYYNATTRSCVQFSYGGCGGNFNNFLSMETCQEVCQSDSHPTAWPSTPTQPSPIYVNTQRRGDHETGILLDMCHDMKSGMSYRNGERWHVDPCTSCSCVSGRALCVAATCPITCLNPVHIEGKCCPICKTDLDDEIIVEGKETRCKDTETELWYHSGESWSKDNCTKCVCFEGEISCMASVCSKPLCSNPVKKEGICCPVCSREHLTVFEPTMETNECRDQSTGKLYLSGEGWNINDCVSCFCGKDGQQMCHKSNCSVLQCKNPVYLQGRCCPVCPEAFHSACIYDNRQYFQGDFMLLRDMCTLCKCNGNMWNCTKKYCSNRTVEIKPTAPNRQDATGNSGFYIKAKGTGHIPTDRDSEEREDYIIEDPFRMTRRDRKNSNRDDENENEIKKVLAIKLKNRLKTTPPVSTDGQSHRNSEHNNTSEEDQINNEDFSWTLEPTKKAAEKETLPWFRDFNYKIWSTWDETEYIDHALEEKNATDIYGKKSL